MFRLSSVGLLLLASVPTLGECQSLDGARAKELSGAVMMTLSLQEMRDMCIGLYPSQASVIRGLYEASAVPTYARLFQLEVNPARKSDRDAELAALGMSEGEASAWCLEDFPSGLDEFDEHYETRQKR